MTTQRVFVLEVLSFCLDKHLAAEKIKLIKVENSEDGLAAVYRTIQLLLGLHLIDRINLDDGYVGMRLVI